MSVEVVESAKLPLDAAEIGRISERHREADWLRELRRSWLQRALETPFPTGLEEEWRRTSLKDLPRRGALLEQAEFRPELPDSRLADRGVVFTDLATAASEHPDLVRPYLGRGEGVASHAAFCALSRAGWPGATFPDVPRGRAVDPPPVARLTPPRPAAPV